MTLLPAQGRKSTGMLVIEWKSAKAVAERRTQKKPLETNPLVMQNAFRSASKAAFDAGTFWSRTFCRSDSSEEDPKQAALGEFKFRSIIKYHVKTGLRRVTAQNVIVARALGR